MPAARMFSLTVARPRTAGWPEPSTQDSVPIVAGLVGAFHRDLDVIGLFLSEFGEVDPELAEVESGDPFVEFLGKRHDAGSIVVLRVVVEFDLGEDLIGERGTHHERRVTGCTAEVEEAAFGEHDDRMAVSKLPFVDLRLNGDPLDTRGRFESGHIDFVIEVTDVADDRVVLHLCHMSGGDDVEVAGGGDEEVGGINFVLEPDHFETFHRGLEGADGVDLGDLHPATLATKALGRALADVAVSAHHRDLAREHDVGGSHDSVDE